MKLKKLFPAPIILLCIAVAAFVACNKEDDRDNNSSAIITTTMDSADVLVGRYFITDTYTYLQAGDTGTGWDASEGRIFKVNASRVALINFPSSHCDTIHADVASTALLLAPNSCHYTRDFIAARNSDTIYYQFSDVGTYPHRGKAIKQH